VFRWLGERTRCTVTLTDEGRTQVAEHESSTDGAHWTASMAVTLRVVGNEEGEVPPRAAHTLRE
jgi:hypothetical protein